MGLRRRAPRPVRILVTNELAGAGVDNDLVTDVNVLGELHLEARVRHRVLGDVRGGVAADRGLRLGDLERHRRGELDVAGHTVEVQDDHVPVELDVLHLVADHVLVSVCCS